MAFVLVYQVLLVDAGSALYASLVVSLVFRPPDHLFWPLWIAKYNGFAVNLAVTWLLLSVSRNLKKLVARTRPVRWRSVLEYRWGWPRLTLNRSHALYTYRVLVAAVLHTLAHVTFTHPYRLDYDTRFRQPITVDSLLFNQTPEFSELPLGTRVTIAVSSFFLDSHTWTGYALLLLLAGPILWSGRRLAGYRQRHYSVLLLHRLFAIITIPLIILHHPIYFWPALWLTLTLVDWLIGWLRYTETCVVEQALRYPNYQLEDQLQLNDVIDLQFRFGRRLRQFQPGDYVRLKVPQVSRLEWHDFTLMLHGDDGVVHVTVRSVGSWTRQLYRLADNARIHVKGPYSMCMYDPLMHRFMLSRTSRFEPASRDNVPPPTHLLRTIPMPRTLVLACSGTAITHFLSILDVLIPLYYTGYRYDELPQKIVVCWTVRTVFNLNFALIPLARYQRTLATNRLDQLLVYEFVVTQKPENSDALSAQTFRRMLMATQSPQILRNSRLSTMDITSGEQVKTVLGSRINYEGIGERHLRSDGHDTLLIINTAIGEMRHEFKKLARRYGCSIHADSLF